MPYLIGPQGLTACDNSDGRPLVLEPHEVAIYEAAGILPYGCHWARVPEAAPVETFAEYDAPAPAVAAEIETKAPDGDEVN